MSRIRVAGTISSITVVDTGVVLTIHDGRSSIYLHHETNFGRPPSSLHRVYQRSAITLGTHILAIATPALAVSASGQARVIGYLSGMPEPTSQLTILQHMHIANYWHAVLRRVALYVSTPGLDPQ